jgi:hypothetical protein
MHTAPRRSGTRGWAQAYGRNATPLRRLWINAPARFRCRVKKDVWCWCGFCGVRHSGSSYIAEGEGTHIMRRQQAPSANNARRLPLSERRATRRDAGSTAARRTPPGVHAVRGCHASSAERAAPEALPRHLFTCGSLVPAQFFLPAQRSLVYWKGEQRLLFAVLQDAVACWFRYRDATTPRGRRLFGETVAWFESPATNWLYAFERICEILALDPDYIRRGLRGWRSGVSIPSTLPGGVRRRIDSRRPFWSA